VTRYDTILLLFIALCLLVIVWEARAWRSRWAPGTRHDEKRPYRA
jgi:ABC-type transport system involved in cytochrome c biogenesis permease subunit